MSLNSTTKEPPAIMACLRVSRAFTAVISDAPR
jgi:hypothetical protein